MIECLILGDSIAVGTQQFRHECAVYAQSGINSQQWRKKYLKSDQGALPQTKTAIISLGSNDHKNVRTILELQTIRRAVNADRVFWILPAIKPDIQDTVRKLAEKYGDSVLPINRLQPDGIHPNRAGYKDIVERIK